MGKAIMTENDVWWWAIHLPPHPEDEKLQIPTDEAEQLQWLQQKPRSKLEAKLQEAVCSVLQSEWLEEQRKLHGPDFRP
jgi:hypothetical protein